MTSVIENERNMKQNLKKSKAEITLSPIYIGVDLSAAWLDVSYEGGYKRFSNNKKGQEELLKHLKSNKGEVHIVYESTGWISRNFSMFLDENKIVHSCLIPCRVRSYANSMGFKAKNDRLDSHVIRAYAEHVHVQGDKPLNKKIQELRQLNNLRELVKKKLKDFKVSTAAYTESSSLDVLKQIRESLEQNMKGIEGKIKELIKEKEGLQKLYDFYLEQPGIGKEIAINLICELPELGHISGKQIAALVGIAPYDHESGGKPGMRHIRFGRKHIRNMLYMGQTKLTGKNGSFRERYEELKTKGKAPKVARIAILRKQLVVLNAKTRDWLQENEDPLA